VVDRSVSLRQLPATVVDLLNLRDGTPFPGASLAGTWTGDAGGATVDPVLTEVVAPVLSPPNHGRSPVMRGSMSALIAGEKVYIRNGNGVEELYDLESDPWEARDLAADTGTADLVRRLGLLMDEMRATGGKTGPSPAAVGGGRPVGPREDDPPA
jgi:hypothetical protein